MVERFRFNPAWPDISRLIEPWVPDHMKFDYNEYIEMMFRRDRDIERWINVIGSGGGKEYATVVVAASNTHQSGKDSADFVATGTGDQATVLAAAESLPLASNGVRNGTVLLLEGDYSFSAACDFTTAIWVSTTGPSPRVLIRGVGREQTRISGSFTGYLFTLPPIYATDAHIQFQDLSLDGLSNTAMNGIRNPIDVLDCNSTSLNICFDLFGQDIPTRIIGGEHGANATGTVVSGDASGTVTISNTPVVIANFTFRQSYSGTRSTKLVSLDDYRVGAITGIQQYFEPGAVTHSTATADRLVRIQVTSAGATARTEGWSIIGNNFGEGCEVILYLERLNQVVIANNAFRRNNSADLTLFLNDCDQGVISGNSFMGSTIAGCDAIQFQNASVGNLVIGNRFYSNTGTSYASAVRFNNTSTTGNVFVPDMNHVDSATVITPFVDNGSPLNRTFMAVGAGSPDQNALFWTDSGGVGGFQKTPVDFNPQIFMNVGGS